MAEHLGESRNPIARRLVAGSSGTISRIAHVSICARRQRRHVVPRGSALRRCGTKQLAAALVLVALFSSGAAFGKDAYLLESGVAPYGATGSGWILSEDFWPAHRFQVNQARTITAAGYFIEDKNPGESSEVFVAIVALDGPDGLPSPTDLSGPDVVAVSVMIVGDEAGDYAADFDLRLQPGWYMVVFGYGAFGADMQTEGATPGPADGWSDGAPGQNMYQLRPETGGASERDAATTRIFVVPEPGLAPLGAAALAGLILVRRPTA